MNGMGKGREDEGRGEGERGGELEGEEEREIWEEMVRRET